jgi:hypothetical protein
MRINVDFDDQGLSFQHEPLLLLLCAELVPSRAGQDFCRHPITPHNHALVLHLERPINGVVDDGPKAPRTG